MSFLVAATNETHPMLFSVKPHCRFLVVRYTEDAGTIQPKKQSKPPDLRCFPRRRHIGGGKSNGINLAAFMPVNIILA